MGVGTDYFLNFCLLPIFGSSELSSFCEATGQTSPSANKWKPFIIQSLTTFFEYSILPPSSAVKYHLCHQAFPIEISG